MLPRRAERFNKHDEGFGANGNTSLDRTYMIGPAKGESINNGLFNEDRHRLFSQPDGQTDYSYERSVRPEDQQ